MKKIIVTVLLLLISLLFLYAAHLDGFVHIRAMAFNPCEFCEFINDHDLEADLQDFPQNEIGAMKDHITVFLSITIKHGTDILRPMFYL